MHSVTELFVTNNGFTEFFKDGCGAVVSAENKGGWREFPEVTKRGDEFLMTTVIVRGITLLPSFQIRPSNAVKEERVTREEYSVEQKAHATHRMTGRVETFALALSPAL